MNKDYFGDVDSIYFFPFVCCARLIFVGIEHCCIHLLSSILLGSVKAWENFLGPWENRLQFKRFCDLNVPNVVKRSNCWAWENVYNSNVWMFLLDENRMFCLTFSLRHFVRFQFHWLMDNLTLELAGFGNLNLLMNSKLICRGRVNFSLELTTPLEEQKPFSFFCKVKLN